MALLHLVSAKADHTDRPKPRNVALWRRESVLPGTPHSGTLSLLSHVLAALRSLRAPPFLDPSSGTSGPSAASFCFLFLLTVTVHELLLSFPLASAGSATGHSRQKGKREERKKQGRKGENWWDSNRGAWVYRRGTIFSDKTFEVSGGPVLGIAEVKPRTPSSMLRERGADTPARVDNI